MLSVGILYTREFRQAAQQLLFSVYLFSNKKPVGVFGKFQKSLLDSLSCPLSSSSALLFFPRFNDSAAFELFCDAHRLFYPTFSFFKHFSLTFMSKSMSQRHLFVWVKDSTLSLLLFMFLNTNRANQTECKSNV